MVAFQRKLKIQCQREEIRHPFQRQNSNHQVAKDQHKNGTDLQRKRSRACMRAAAESSYQT